MEETRVVNKILCSLKKKSIMWWSQQRNHKIQKFFQYKVSQENYKSIKKESMKFKKIQAYKHFFQRKIVLDIPKEVKYVNKTKKKVDLEQEVEAASTGQLIDQIKIISQLV